MFTIVIRYCNGQTDQITCPEVEAQARVTGAASRADVASVLAWEA